MPFRTGQGKFEVSRNDLKITIHAISPTSQCSRRKQTSTPYRKHAELFSASAQTQLVTFRVRQTTAIHGHTPSYRNAQSSATVRPIKQYDQYLYFARLTIQANNMVDYTANRCSTPVAHPIFAYDTWPPGADRKGAATRFILKLQIWTRHSSITSTPDSINSAS